MRSSLSRSRHVAKRVVTSGGAEQLDSRLGSSKRCVEDLVIPAFWCLAVSF
jgi:hypothetical protein